MKKDYYSILGIDDSERKLQGDEFTKSLKKKYLQLAKQYHPDKYSNKSEEERKNAEEKFKEIAEAYSVLSDTKKRQQYDTYGTVDGNPFEGFQSTGMGDLNEMLNMFRNMHSGFGFGFGDGFGFGSSSRRGGNPQTHMPEPLQIHLRVTVEEIYKGETKHLKYKYKGVCSSCNGTGHLNGGKVEKCSHCGGTGVFVEREQRGYATYMTQTVCPYCGGDGSVITNPCSKCGGTGLEVKYDEIDVEIPIGACDGAYIQINGKGNCAKNHPEIRGVLIIIFDVQQDAKFSIVNQYDLLTTIEVPILDCITGGKQTFKMMDGNTYSFNLESGAESGKTIKLREMGLRKTNGRGDLYVKIKQRFPKSLGKQEIKDIDKLKKLKAFN